MLCYSLHGMAWHSIAVHCTAVHGTACCCTAWSSTVQYGMYGMVHFSTVHYSLCVCVYILRNPQVHKTNMQITLSQIIFFTVYMSPYFTLIVRHMNVLLYCIDEHRRCPRYRICFLVYTLLNEGNLNYSVLFICTMWLSLVTMVTHLHKVVISGCHGNSPV